MTRQQTTVLDALTRRLAHRLGLVKPSATLAAGAKA